MNHAIGLLARALPVSVVLFLIIFLSSKYIFKKKLPGRGAIFMFFAIWAIATIVQVAKVSQEGPHATAVAQVSSTSPTGAQLSLESRKLTPEEQTQLTIKSGQVELPDDKSEQIQFPSEARPTQDLKDLISDSPFTDLSDRTPRPHFAGCSNDLEAYCHLDRTLLTEAVDPRWSEATEKQLRAIWNENVPELSDDFLFVKCTTTVCQVNYRFPVETGVDKRAQELFYAFTVGLRKSTLASELHTGSITISPTIISRAFKRNRSQGDR